MSKKNQVYLSAFLMYLVVGLTGYINAIGSYWSVLIISLLLAGYTLVNVFNKEENLVKETKFEWISVCIFLGLETIFTFALEVFNVGFIGFKYFVYIVQSLGLLLAIYSIVKYVLNNTRYYALIKEKLTKKEIKPEVVVSDEVKEEIAASVEEVIQEETSTQEEIDMDSMDVTINENREDEVLGIECKKEEVAATPYMEEEM